MEQWKFKYSVLLSGFIWDVKAQALWEGDEEYLFIGDSWIFCLLWELLWLIFYFCWVQNVCVEIWKLVFFFFYFIFLCWTVGAVWIYVCWGFFFIFCERCKVVQDKGAFIKIIFNTVVTEKKKKKRQGWRRFGFCTVRKQNKSHMSRVSLKK